jgi:methanogenic corrinoid protein MtbC1
MKFHIESQKDLLLRGNHNVSQVLQDMKDRENQEILELQKARLDRQIAQFDVLQKLLVKA